MYITQKVFYSRRIELLSMPKTIFTISVKSNNFCNTKFASVIRSGFIMITYLNILNISLFSFTKFRWHCEKTPFNMF